MDVFCRILIVLFYLCTFYQGFSFEEVFGCGGFVKSHFTINYSRVEIKLYTKQGSLKYQTDCAPNNGYYLIPLYDKGDYVLKIEPPPGWSFEPSSVKLHVDGNTDPCSQNQDINFVFKGFSLSGKVLSYGQDIGPQGIGLFLKGRKNEVILETQTTSNGIYSFSDVFPGSYIIEARHSSYSFEQDRESVQIVDDNVESENKIVVSGFDVRGHVYSEGEPIQGVHFLLFSKQVFKKSLPGCDSKAIKSFHLKKENEKYICHVTSSNNGSFHFPSIPTGSYILIPFYKGEHIEFDVSPPEVEFEVKQTSFAFPDNFQVKGFSVMGHVLESENGKGLEGAKIYINSKLHTTTESNGVYHLENMKTGVYIIDVKVENIVFNSVEMKVTPNTPLLPNILASQFFVCGEIKIVEYPKGLPTPGDRVMLFKSADKGELHLSVDKDGKFCTAAKPGKYSLTPVISETEENYGLQFFPKQLNVHVTSLPILGLIFKQFTAVVKGQIKCIKKCGFLAVGISSQTNEEYQWNTLTSDDGKFQVQGCLPGKYVLSVSRENWCFQTKQMDFTIGNTDVSSLELKQSGYQAIITLTHASSFKVKYPSSEMHTVQLHNAKNILCLPESGVYDFIPLGCHLYKSKSFKFDTNNPTEFDISPVKHLVTGNVLTEVNVSDIRISLQSQSGTEIIHLEQPVELNKNVFRYTFSVFVEPNTELEVKATSQKLLFRPSVAKVSVLDDCIDNAVQISGKEGLFINGNITPPLENVKIRVMDSNSGLKQSEVLTDKSGHYEVGPLDDENDYSVEAEKPGFFFTQVKGSSSNFNAFKLAEIVVEVKTAEGKALPGVLLSLSGGVDYRKNSLTQKDGKLKFIGLSPGQYFLRPMLKEYEFQPSTKMIDIKEGTLVNVKISGKRVAYSLFGVVNSLTGESEVGVAVEAVGIEGETCQQYQEEAVSEQGGHFRIRGLQPGCQYNLRLKKGNDVNQHIERSAPPHTILKVTDGDINNIRMIVFRHFNQMDISGNIATTPEYLSTLKVRLHCDENPEQVLHTVSLGQSSFFFMPSMPIDKRTYTVRVDSSLPSSSYVYDPPAASFTANKSFYHFTFTFDPKLKSNDHEMSQNSILTLPFFMLVILLVYNYNKVLNLIVQLFQSIPVIISPLRYQFAGESSIENPSLRKKVKPKRL